MRCCLNIGKYCCSTGILPKIIAIFKCRSANPCQIGRLLFCGFLVCQKLLFLIANYMSFQILLWIILKVFLAVFYATWRVVHLLFCYRNVILWWTLHHKVVRCSVAYDFLECIHVYFRRLFLFLAHVCVRRGVLLYVIWFFYLIKTLGGDWWLILLSTDARYFG